MTARLLSIAKALSAPQWFDCTPQMRIGILASMAVSGLLAISRAEESRVEPVIAVTIKIPDVSAVVGQPYELLLTATNKAKVKIMVPINGKGARDEWVWDGIGIKFSTQAAIQRSSIFTDPLTVDHILPGETKTFRISWIPNEFDQGSGKLSLMLPPEFEPLAPVDVTVNPPMGRPTKALRSPSDSEP